MGIRHGDDSQANLFARFALHRHVQVRLRFKSGSSSENENGHDGRRWCKSFGLSGNGTSDTTQNRLDPPAIYQGEGKGKKEGTRVQPSRGLGGPPHQNAMKVCVVRSRRDQSKKKKKNNPPTK